MNQSVTFQSEKLAAHLGIAAPGFLGKTASRKSSSFLGNLVVPSTRIINLLDDNRESSTCSTQVETNETNQNPAGFLLLIQTFVDVAAEGSCERLNKD